MKRKIFLAMLNTALTIFITTLVSGSFVLADGANKTIHVFKGGSAGADGTYPQGPLILDTAGNLYGTTFGGGIWDGRSGHGTVFELTPESDGSWTKHVLYRFTGGADGSSPFRSGVTADGAGNLYGTTYQGGAFGQGNVFKLTRNSDGTWTESVLHQFTVIDGSRADSPLTFDKTGNLYGTTALGGAWGCGTVFTLIPNSDGSWTHRVLHAFKVAEGYANVVLDPEGNLYGAAYGGGKFGSGIVFKLTPNSDGTWAESLLHQFTGSGKDEGHPTGIVLDGAGDLYGTTAGGTVANMPAGTVYKLIHSPTGGWTLRVLHQFPVGGKQGADPEGGVILDKDGNLLGTTYYGGAYGYGNVFKLTPTAAGGWATKILWSFRDQSGADPVDPLLLDGTGNIYGTTMGDEFKTFGTVFKITP